MDAILGSVRVLALVVLLGCGAMHAVDDPNSCHKATDCTGGAFCGSSTLEPLCHGMTESDFSHPCQADGECATLGANEICDNRLCIVPQGGAQPLLHCRPGCSGAADCLPGEMCGTDHRCAAATCTPTTDCGANDTCTNGTCAPLPCAHDPDCGGYCVDGFCAPSAGACHQAVP